MCVCSLRWKTTLKPWVKMRFVLKWSQNNVFPGKLCLDFLSESHKACLSAYFQSRILTLLLQFTLHFIACQVLTWDTGTLGAQGRAARVPRGEGREPGVAECLPVTLPPAAFTEEIMTAAAITPGLSCLELEEPAKPPTPSTRVGE